MNSAFDTGKSVLEELFDPSFEAKGIRLFVKRDDLIDPFVSGNKWRKLKYNIELAIHQKKEGILTLGGAYSNHLLATAAACNQVGLQSIGLVRGEELSVESNPNLMRCSELGMQLKFISRTEYSWRDEKWQQEEWKESYPRFHFVPEGGANYHGIMGCQEIWSEIDEKIDAVFVAQGTSTTSCGLLLGLPDDATLHVVPVLQQYDSKREMSNLLYPVLLDDELIQEYLERVNVYAEYTFGGYAKSTPELMKFIQKCREKWNLPLDSVYTAKVFYGLLNKIETTSKLDTKNILFIHTGGISNSK